MTSQEGARILLVDDDSTARRRHRWALEQGGFRVAESPDADQALDLIRSYRPHLLLLDLVMPARSGWEVLGALALHPELPGAPVVALTTSPEEESEALARDLGAAAYVVKPISDEDLLALVRRLLRSNGARPRS